MTAAILTLENACVQVRMHADCSGTITDKSSHTEWVFHPVALQEEGPIMMDRVWTCTTRSFCDYYPGHFTAQKVGDHSLRVQLTHSLGHAKGSFTCHIILDGPWVEFRLEDIDDTLPSLVFPPHIISDSLILPSGVGRWQREPSSATTFLTQATSLNMRWIGGLKEDTHHGWMAIYGDGYADSGAYLHGMAIAPTWLQSLNAWTPTRSIRYRCVNDGYVEMAKVFRQFAIEQGFFRSLQDKIAECPALDALRGGRIMSFFLGSTRHVANYLDNLQTPPADVLTHDGEIHVQANYKDVAEVMREAKALGMSRGIFNLRGVIRGGYDDSHPDIWPPEPAYGSEEELRTLMAEGGNFVSLLHDNYQDAYPRAASFPQGVIHLPNGDLMPGGYWHGGQCYILNPREALHFVKRNWEYYRTLSPRGLFVDTMASVQFYQDYNPAASLSRTQDWQAKVAIMDFYKSQGVILGSENAGDFGMGHLDFLENRHNHQIGESIPLWPLVFHDAAFCARYPSHGTSGGEVGRSLEDALWGYAIMWPGSTAATLLASQEPFKYSLSNDALHARIGTAEMLTHRYVCEDAMVEQTEFSTGVSVLANFAHEPRQVFGREIPAQDYLILE